MDNGMAIRADRPEVSQRINEIPNADVAQRDGVMYVDEIRHCLAVALAEGHIADRADRAIVSNTSLTSARIALEPIYHYADLPAFCMEFSFRLVIGPCAGRISR